MADAPVPSLTRAREQKISELSQHFANDDLSLDELERRIELVYKAGSVAELDSITADLRLAPASPGVTPAPASPRQQVMTGMEARRGRLLAIMGESRRTGRWLVPSQLRVVSLMSDTRLDLTQAVMASGIAEIHVTAMWSSCRLIVPPGMRVINEMHAVMASATSNADEMDPPGVSRTNAPTIRLTGTAFMAEVKVTVRRREDPAEEE
ncbi:MAG TPA: DUF1707 domain-containing protein [Gemmatimonadaceae bacterium]|jgi:uncharacterized protein DUF1707|nr:DUF1707 domain-containing protein [Gemmatimonadaceae bacterium]